MRKFIIVGTTLAALVVTPAVASADVSTNGTTNDAYGYCIANHIANFNGDHNGIGYLRSQISGKEISGGTGNRAPSSLCVDTHRKSTPISPNG